MPRHEGTILGGLPIIADVSFGYDSFAGEYWAEVSAIYWRKRDGTAGKEIPAKVRDRAERYDTYFSSLIEEISEALAYEASLDGEGKEPALVKLEKGE